MKKNFLSLAVGTALVASAAASASIQPVTNSNYTLEQKDAIESQLRKEDAYKHAIKISENKISVIIQLEDVPAALFEAVNPAMNDNYAGNGRTKPDFHSNAAKEYIAYLEEQQNSVISQASSVDSNFKSGIRFNTLINGFEAEVSRDKVYQLANLPGVKTVYPNMMRHQTMDASLELIKAPEVWEAMGGNAEAGKGIKVGIIDSGIRPENPLFSGEGFTRPEGLPTDDYCGTVDEAFCNGKLILARAATVPDSYVLTEGEYNGSPLGFNGHGTHVAGTAVGNFGVEGERDGATATLSGVAPAAYLMVYKGLYASASNPASSGGTDSMLLEMLEASVADGADIVNNSWGGGAGTSPVGSPYTDVFAAAKASGTTMVFAAGNSGPGAQTIGCPGCSGDVLTVANSTTNRLFANPLSVDGVDDLQNMGALFSGPVAVTEDISAPMVAALQVEPENFEGCNAYTDPEAFSGAMAVISRGACTFAAKIANAQAAGAVAAIIYNQAGRGEAPAGMGGLDATVQTIPSLMVSFTEGTNLANYLVENPGAAGTLGAEIIRTTNDAIADLMNDSSSRGPNGAPDILKPNLAAPGTRIFSAESPDAPGHEGESFSFKGGTSMASPHVAGAAALIKQLNPDWTPDQIMSAVTATAVRDGMKKEDAATAADAFDRGAGRLDVDRASKANVTFSELGLAANSCFVNCSWSFSATNHSGDAVTLSATEFMDGDAGFSIDISPSTATMAAGESAEFTVTVDATSATTNTWAFGGVDFDDSNAATPTYFVPLAVRAIDTENSSLINSTTTASVAAAEEAVTLAASVSNSNITDTITLTAAMDSKFVVDEASVGAMIDGVAQDVTYDAATNTATWSGTLAPSVFSIDAPAGTTGPDEVNALIGAPQGTFISLSRDFGWSTLDCGTSCDDSSIPINLPIPITYLGTTYTTMQVSTNGYIALGDTGNVNSSLSQPLPFPDEPNNVIAPLWMDLDLDGSSDTDGGAGTVAVNILDLPFNGCAECGIYYVIEWIGAEIYQVPGETYDFQIWINTVDGSITFNYGGLGSFPEMLNQFGLGMTVGAEDSTGSIGITHARINPDNSVEGTIPTAGQLQLTSALGQSVGLNVTGALAAKDAVINDAATIDEDGSVTVDVLANDNDRTAVNTFTVTGGGNTAQAFKAVSYNMPALDNSTLAITTDASNGTTAITEDGVLYTPNANYNGSDSFEYSVTDADGTVLTATANFTINPVDDVPTMSVTAPSQTIEGHYFDINVAVVDVDGDTTTTINGEETTSIRVLAPEVDSAGSTLVYNIVVTDGITTLNQTVSVSVSDAPPSSSGSMPWYALLLLPLTFLRRRKMH